MIVKNDGKHRGPSEETWVLVGGNKFVFLHGAKAHKNQRKSNNVKKI